MVKCNLQNGQPNPSWTSITLSPCPGWLRTVSLATCFGSLARSTTFGKEVAPWRYFSRNFFQCRSRTRLFRAKSGGGIVASARWWFFEGFVETVCDVFFLTRNWKRSFLSKCTGSTHGTGNKNKVAKPDSESGGQGLECGNFQIEKWSAYEIVNV